MPRPFGRPTKYRLRVSYKVMVGDVEVKSQLGAESQDKDISVARAEIDAAFSKVAEIIGQAGGYDAAATLVTVDQHGNTRQEAYVGPSA